jgi:hypothetical protein
MDYELVSDGQSPQLIGCRILRAARECARESSCRRAGQARPGRILPLCLRSWSVRLVPVTLHAPSQYSASVSGGPTSSMLSPSVGVGHSPLAVGLGPSAGLLVGVPDRRPVSPLSSPRACSGAGPGWHGCGWIAVSAALSEGPAPWRWSLFGRCPSPVGRRRGDGSPAARGCAGHGDTGPSAACQLVRASLRVCIWSNGSQPEPGLWPPGQVVRKVEPGVALGGHGHAHPFKSATDQLTRGMRRRSRIRYQLLPPPQAPGPWAPGGRGLGCWHRDWQARDLGAITAHHDDCSGHGAGLARADCDRLTRAG